ncbi:MAG: archaetidylserine decarboxylase [Oceanococcaceae bacterium]
MIDREQAFVAFQRLLPTLALTGLAHRLAQSEALGPTLIRQAIRAFDIDMSEAAEPDPAAYPTFNAFFVRALREGARPLAEEPALISPVDGRISQIGRIEQGRILQAKGRDFSVEELLDDTEAAKAYEGGRFATIYLAPSNYHRIHTPLAGRLASARYIPGRLLAVNPPTVRAAARLFSRNERMACHFQTEQAGPWAIVLVGALLVSGIETVETGVVTPPHGGQARDWNWENPRAYERGEELGRFNYGSTVVLLLPPNWRWLPDAVPGAAVRMGQALGAPS